MSVAKSPIKFLPREEIERRAAEMRRDVDWKSIPVDAIAIADQLEIDVILTEFDDPAIVGLIQRKQPVGWEILVSDRGSSRRQCFTVAHELGHYALHLRDEGTGEFVDTDALLYRMVEGASSSDRGDRAMEIQANMFAAALLMPESRVRQEWTMHRSVSALSKTFSVSQVAMRYRIEQLELW